MKERKYKINNKSSADNHDENSLNSYTKEEKSKDSKSYYKSSKQIYKMRLKEEKKRQREADRKNKWFFRVFWIFMVAIVSVTLSQFFMNGVRDMIAMNRQQEEVVSISFPSNPTKEQVAQILEQGGVIESAKWFDLYTSVFKRSMRFTKGDYEIKKNLEYEEIISYINTQSNRLDIMNVTFAEGLTVIEYGQILEDNNVCTKAAFLEKCNSTEFYEDYPFLQEIENLDQCYYKLEGYLYPDTYKFYQDTDPSKVIRKMLDNFEDKIIEPHSVDGYEEKISLQQIAQDKKGLSLVELMTLASMVQSEASDEEDMRVIASVFENRLSSTVDSGFLYLNSDPTMYYPYRSPEELPQGFESTYNTYKNQGLPVGPIRNPGMQAINAVINHGKSYYMYFCHDAEGNPYYATTESQHINNQIKAGIRVE
ncbi:MAG: endolytic transglycosylase MltG [Clostridia bacterium]|nr:endolytic transglycosylase MltG [Clostridia bacterium]